MQKFLNWFAKDNPEVAINSKAIFVDKVKGDIRILEQAFPDIPVLSQIALIMQSKLSKQNSVVWRFKLPASTRY